MMEICSLVRQVGVDDGIKHVLYNTWRMMNYRCYSDVHTSFATYGGSGIQVCSDWRWDNPNGFYNFLNAVGDRPDGCTLDRIDPWGDYNKNNCRWADKRTQQNNFRTDSDNESGHMGVVKKHGKWIAQITLNEEMWTINYYTNLDEAIKNRNFVAALKMSEGDESAIQYIIDNTISTPIGKRFYGRKTSKYYGVSWNKRIGKWRGAVSKRFSGKLKQVHLGIFDSEDAAYEEVLKFLEKEKLEAENGCVRE